MAAKQTVLESLTVALAALPVPKSRATGIRWLREHPGLGVTSGGRQYIWTLAREAIGRGVPLADAARIGAESGRAA